MGNGTVTVSPLELTVWTLIQKSVRYSLNRVMKENLIYENLCHRNLL